VARSFLTASRIAAAFGSAGALLRYSSNSSAARSRIRATATRPSAASGRRRRTRLSEILAGFTIVPRRCRVGKICAARGEVRQPAGHHQARPAPALHRHVLANRPAAAAGRRGRTFRRHHRLGSQRHLDPGRRRYPVADSRRRRSFRAPADRKSRGRVGDLGVAHGRRLDRIQGPALTPSGCRRRRRETGPKACTRRARNRSISSCST